MKIPFVDLKAQYLSLKNEIDTAIQHVIDDCAFIGTANNKYVKKFEQEFASYIGTSYCIGTANGTDSLEIILKALDIGSGDEVIVPALSWISTSEAVSNVGAKPVFVDIEPDYYTIDVSKIEARITSNTKAVIPVHLYGHPADMPAILDLANKHHLFVAEDCAQAHGAEINGKKVGTFGNAGSFSFFPGKNLGAYGDAGGIVTIHEELVQNCRMISQHGQLEKKHHHYREGRNSRLDGIQAAILSIKLKYLPQWTELRIQHANLYSSLLNGYVKTPIVKAGYKHVFHLYIIETLKRDQTMQQLKEAEIDSAVQYPTALPFLEAYKFMDHISDNFPVAFQVTQKILSLPIFPELTKKQIEYITDIVSKVV